MSDGINTSETDEVRDRARKFGVTPGEPEVAVKAVGNEATAEEAHLKSKR
jgi:hypothetical protein